MSTGVRTCRRCGNKFKGRCPKCHPRRSSSSRPLGKRGQSAVILERLVRFESTPIHLADCYVTTATFTRRWLDRSGVLAWSDLTDAEYVWLLDRSSRLADRWHRMFGSAVPEPAQLQVVS